MCACVMCVCVCVCVCVSGYLLVSSWPVFWHPFLTLSDPGIPRRENHTSRASWFLFPILLDIFSWMFQRPSIKTHPKWNWLTTPSSNQPPYLSEWVNVTTTHSLIHTRNQGMVCDTSLARLPAIAESGSFCFHSHAWTHPPSASPPQPLSWFREHSSLAWFTQSPPTESSYSHFCPSFLSIPHIFWYANLIMPPSSLKSLLSGQSPCSFIRFTRPDLVPTHHSNLLSLSVLPMSCLSPPSSSVGTSSLGYLPFWSYTYCSLFPGKFSLPSAHFSPVFFIQLSSTLVLA